MEEARLFAAIEKDDAAAVESLLKAEPRLAAARSGGVSAVMTALYHRKKAALETLLAAKPPLDVFEAAALGDLERLKKLIEQHPTRVDARAADGFTALHLACWFRHVDVAEYLLDHGADVDAVADNQSAVMPLHSAAAARSAELVGLLLESGADPNAQQSGGYTALHSAAQHRDTKIARLLVAKKADVDLKADDGKTPRSLAAAAGAQDILALFPEPPAD